MFKNRVKLTAQIRPLKAGLILQRAEQRAPRLAHVARFQAAQALYRQQPVIERRAAPRELVARLAVALAHARREEPEAGRVLAHPLDYGGEPIVHQGVGHESEIAELAQQEPKLGVFETGGALVILGEAADPVEDPTPDGHAAGQDRPPSLLQ